MGLLPPLPPLGERLKRDGIATVAAHNPDWHARALAHIRELPKGAEFTGEDVVTTIGEPPSKNSAGAAISGAARKGLIARVAKWRKAVGAKKHAHLNPVWVRR